MSWAEPVSWWKYTNSIFKTRHFYTPRWSCISDNETLQAATLFRLSVCVDLGTYVSYLFVCLCVFTLHSCLRSPQDQNNSWESHFCHSSIPLVCCRSALSLTCCPITHMHTHTQSANQRSEKGHLCLPGLPGDKEKAVIGGIDPVGASLADHHSAAGVSAAAAAAVMLQEDIYISFYSNERMQLYRISSE